MGFRFLTSRSVYDELYHPQCICPIFVGGGFSGTRCGGARGGQKSATRYPARRTQLSGAAPRHLYPLRISSLSEARAQARLPSGLCRMAFLFRDCSLIRGQNNFTPETPAHRDTGRAKSNIFQRIYFMLFQGFLPVSAVKVWILTPTLPLWRKKGI